MESTVISIRSLAGCVGTAVFVVSCGASALAQTTAPPPGAGAPLDHNARAADRARQVSESRLRSNEMDAVVESENEKRIQAAIVHIRKDFTRIQVLRNDIARNLVARKPLVYALVAEQTAEINKRANDINIYMMARSADDKEQDKPSDLTSDEMVGALVRLCKLIDNFTENPRLKNAGTVDVKEVERARGEKVRADQDLLAIIKLSESIKKKSESLKPPG
jgi:hypothetical protein